MFAEVVKLFVDVEEFHGILEIDNDPVDGAIGEVRFVNMDRVREFYEVNGWKTEKDMEEDEWGYDTVPVFTKLVFDNGEEWAVKETPTQIYNQTVSIGVYINE